MNKKNYLLLLGCSMAMAGCTMAPKYSRPAPPVPANWTKMAAQADSDASPNAVKAARLKWQDFHPDKNLQALIEKALKNNRDLRLAMLNVERSRAMYGIQRASLTPTINANGSASKQRIPADLSSSKNRQTVERYDANLGVAAWEIDFFGRIRSFKERSLEEYFASEQAQRGAQILLISSVANTYLALAADRENYKLAETTCETQKNTYELIKRRHEQGLLPELDVFRAQTQVEVARVDMARFKQMIEQDENALSLLLGEPVSKDLLPADLSAVVAPKEILAGLPSDTLLMRPDVLQTEHLLRAAYADLGAARAAFFPRITLTAAFGTASSDLSGLFKAGSGAWSYAPQIVMPIFDARTWSAHKAAKVQREMAVTQYEKTIQSAFREVADTLAFRVTLDEQLAAQRALVKAVSETHRLSNLRYDKGLDSYLSVLDAQRTLYAAQQGLVTLRMNQLANNVHLFAVLGGGGDIQKTQTPPQSQPKDPPKKKGK